MSIFPGLFRHRAYAATAVTFAATALTLASAISANAESVDLRPVGAKEIQAQIASLASTVERYYPLLKNARKKHQFMTEARHLETSLTGPIPAWHAWLLQQELLRSMNDPHLILYPIQREDQMLPATIDWVSNGILISPNSWAHSKPFPNNSQLLRIGTYTPSALLKKRESLFAGTIGWIKESRYLPGYYLHWLGVVGPRGRVALTIRTPDGAVEHVPLSLVTLPKNWIAKLSKHNDKSWYSWKIYPRDNVGWFTLHEMNFTMHYEQAVSAFFRAVEKAGITRVAVDVRHNGGGWSLAEAPFFEYMGIRQFRDYDREISLQPTVLQSHINRDLRGIKALSPGFYKFLYSRNAPKALRIAPRRRFRGTLYIVTGPGSFSSAMTFAADVKFNNLGVVIGEPCGETLTGTGDVKEFPHPPSGVPFQVPTTSYDWPGVPPGTVVTPDISIPMTINDVRQSKNPVLQWFAATAPKHHTPAVNK